MENLDRRIDWGVRDVMVGLLHNCAQLEVNLTHQFYHMPMALLACPPEQVRTVALYQSKKLFGENVSGVRMFGEVDSVKVLPRGEITEIPCRGNPDERYCRFAVREWERLPRRIKAGGLAPGVSMFTNRFLLENSRYFPELYLRSERQLALYTLLRKASARTIRHGGPELLPSKEGYTVIIAQRDIGVYTPDGRYEQHDLRDFFQEPYSFLEELGAVVALEVR